MAVGGLAPNRQLNWSSVHTDNLPVKTLFLLLNATIHVFVISLFNVRRKAMSTAPFVLSSSLSLLGQSGGTLSLEKSMQVF